MQCTPEHSTLVLYAAPTGTNTTALPTLLGTDSDSRNKFAVSRYAGGDRHPFNAAQLATLPPLNVTGTEAAPGLPRVRWADNPVFEKAASTRGCEEVERATRLGFDNIMGECKLVATQLSCSLGR